MFISFIVPVYNTEKYIAQCLDSLLTQDISKNEYEIICVNDGSTDGSLDVLHGYEKNYNNVHIITQPNSGVCVARNTGIKAATGDYIWFIDADDLIAENCLNALKNSFADKAYDRIVIGNYSFTDNSELNTEKMEKNTAWRDSVVWLNILKRQFLIDNNLMFYPGLVFGEDALYMFEIFLNKPNTFEYELLLYYHRIVIGSASNSKSDTFKVSRVNSTLQEAKIVKKYYEQENCPYPTETANRLMIFLWGGLDAVAQMPKKQAKNYLKDLKACGLYPYKTPADCTVTKSCQLNRNDFVGKAFDYVYTHMHRPWGFHCMRILRKKIK
ncbi:MAG: glycosyltransferase [Clostridia bacterium]|nr:glycosyltransferase [Clostridia bacterium]